MSNGVKKFLIFCVVMTALLITIGSTLMVYFFGSEQGGFISALMWIVFLTVIFTVYVFVDITED